MVINWPVSIFFSLPWTKPFLFQSQMVWLSMALPIPGLIQQGSLILQDKKMSPGGRIIGGCGSNLRYSEDRSYVRGG